tara:strand:- start:5160 stop:5855 length:696 start_codon:yes stop_codon:yes gene_type:complete
MAKFNLDDYEMVKDRLPFFYEKYTDGRITTEIYSESEDHVTIKASLYGGVNDQVALSPLSTGYAREERGGHIDKYTENCETSAIGRALANLNIYGDVAESTGNRPSREEMNSVKQDKQSLAEYAENNLDLPKVKSKPKAKVVQRTGDGIVVPADLNYCSGTNKNGTDRDGFCSKNPDKMNLVRRVPTGGPNEGAEVIKCNNRLNDNSWCNFEMLCSDWDNASEAVEALPYE